MVVVEVTMMIKRRRRKSPHLLQGQQRQVFAHNNIMKVLRQINMHERPYDPPRERRQQVPAVDEYDAAFALE
jgi:hypothetical protein